MHRSSRITRRGFLSLVFLAISLIGSARVPAQTAQRSPSDTVREFYKAMRERRYKDAWSMTIYKPAIESLTAEEMEDLRPTFEDQASHIPEAVEITGETIEGNVAKVYVKLPPSDSTPQVTSEPVLLLNSGGTWIVGDETNQAIVKRAGRRYFLDVVLDLNHNAMEDLLKRLVALEAVYAQTHNGSFGDVKGLLGAGLISNDEVDPKIMGYNFHLDIGKDGRSFVAGAEPTRYDHSGKLSFWMDQTGNIRKIDIGGKALTGDSPKH